MRKLALTIAVILAIGMLPFNASAATPMSYYNSDITTFGKQEEPPCPYAPYEYEQNNEPIDPIEPVYPIDPPAPMYPSDPDAPKCCYEAAEPLTYEYPDEPFWSIEPCFWLECNEYCGYCGYCELGIMAAYMTIMPMQAFAGPASVWPIAGRGTLGNDAATNPAFNVTIPAVNFSAHLFVSPRSLFLAFTLSGGDPSWRVGGGGGPLIGGWQWAGFALGTDPDANADLERLFGGVISNEVLTGGNTQPYTYTTVNTAFFPLDALFDGGNVVTRLFEGAITATFGFEGGSNETTLAVDIVQFPFGIAPIWYNILPATALTHPPAHNQDDYRERRQRPEPTPTPIPVPSPTPLPELTAPDDIIIHILTDEDIVDILLAAQEYGHAVIVLDDTYASGVNIPGHLFEVLAEMETYLVIVLQDGTLMLDSELVQSIANKDMSRVELILYHYEEEEIICDVQDILCYGDELLNVQLLIDGTAVTYFAGRLAITVEYNESPSPGVWRIGRYGDLYPQEFIFDAEAELVTFFPDRLSNFIVGYSAEARTMAIFRADGNFTTLYSRGRETTNLRSGQRLSRGDRLVTGRVSEIFFTMDNSSIIKLGENTEAEIREAGRNLEIMVQSGNVLVRVENQLPHHATTVRTQNLTIGVRGTMFTLSIDADGSETIAMLSGYAVINGVTLMAGYMFILTIGTDHAENEYTVMPITLGTINDFTLAAIVGNFAYLADNLDIDLAGVEVEAQPLPTPQEIADLLLEDYDYEFEVDAYCDDDCVLQDELHMLPGRRQIGIRC